MILKFCIYFVYITIIFDIGLSKLDNSFEEFNDDKINFLRKYGKQRFTRQVASTCICVPAGTCGSAGTVPGGTGTGTFPGTGTLPGGNDGSGRIDVRIVGSQNNIVQPNIVNPTTNPTVPCMYNLVQCCQAGAYRCGIRYPPPANSPPVTGDQAPFGAYPWQAAILNSFNGFVGSGALIDNLNILTVAHKVANFTSNPTSLKVRMGEWDTSSTREPIPAQEQIVVRIFIHPNFTANNLFNDVAIIRVSSSFSLGSVPTIGTACLPTSTPFGSTCFISGWGKNDFSASGQYQTIQKFTDVMIRQQSDCQTLLRSTLLGQSFNYNSLSFICAGGTPGKDACTGDGGAPMVCLTNNQWYVVGLVAWGIGCGTANVPGVYVHIVPYVGWINQMRTIS